jgi:hypothetical protein
MQNALVWLMRVGIINDTLIARTEVKNKPIIEDILLFLVWLIIKAFLINEPPLLIVDYGSHS